MALSPTLRDVLESEYEIGKDGLAVIVVGFDGSDPSINASAWAAGLARREHAKLVLTYVEPLTSSWSPVIAAGAAAAGLAFVEEIHKNAEHYLQPQGIRYEIVHHRGEPAHGLEAVAAEVRADCIVVGRSDTGGGALGSVAKSLINLATRPVVVIP